MVKAVLTVKFGALEIPITNPELQNRLAIYDDNSDGTLDEKDAKIDYFGDNIYRSILDNRIDFKHIGTPVKRLWVARALQEAHADVDMAIPTVGELIQLEDTFSKVNRADELMTKLLALPHRELFSRYLFSTEYTGRPDNSFWGNVFRASTLKDLLGSFKLIAESHAESVPEIKVNTWDQALQITHGIREYNAIMSSAERALFNLYRSRIIDYWGGPLNGIDQYGHQTTATYIYVWKAPEVLQPAITSLAAKTGGLMEHEEKRIACEGSKCPEEGSQSMTLNLRTGHKICVIKKKGEEPECFGKPY